MAKAIPRTYRALITFIEDAIYITIDANVEEEGQPREDQRRLERLLPSERANR